MRDLRSQFGHLHTTAARRHSVAILPDRFEELWRLDNDFRENDTGHCLYRCDVYMYPSIEAETQACVVPVEYQISTSQKYLTRGGCGDSGGFGHGVGLRSQLKETVGTDMTIRDGDGRIAKPSDGSFELRVELRREVGMLEPEVGGAVTKPLLFPRSKKQC